MIFEEITEDILNEKLITYGNRKPYGQIVFIAGGAGSGKGFAISNFIDSASFKIRDVDEMKKQLQILNRLGKLDINSIIKKYGKSIKPKDIDLINKIQDDGFKLQNLNLKNSDHVYALHILVKAIGIKDTSLEKLLLGKNNPETLPNILFDITAKDVTDITSIIPKLKAVGYKPENIHLTWVLTKYVTAIENNKKRERRVPEDIMLKTHEGASNTIWGLITKALPKGMNGRVDVILNNPENTVFLKGADGKDVEKRQTSSTNKVVKGIDGKQKTIRTTTSKNVKFTSGFLSLPLKKEKGGIYAEKVWKDKLFNWVKSNAPDSITANMKESVNESQQANLKSVDVLRRAVQKINKKYKVQVSKIGPTKGEVEIELGDGNHPDTDYRAIDKLVKKIGIKNYSVFNESIDEATFRPNSGTMSGGTHGLDNRKYQLKRDVKGVRIGDYTNIILPKGTIIYNIPGGVFAHHDVLAAYQSGQNKYFNKPTFKGISIKRTKNTIMAIEKNSKILESVNEGNLKLSSSAKKYWNTSSKKLFGFSGSNPYDNVPPSQWNTHPEIIDGYGKNAGADIFKGFIRDKINGNGHLDSKVAKMIGLPTNVSIIDYLSDGGSGLNGNKNFKRFKTWFAALYDIYEEMEKKFGKVKGESVNEVGKGSNWAEKYVNDTNLYKKLNWYMKMGKGAEKKIKGKEFVIMSDGSALIWNTKTSDWELYKPKRIDKKTGKPTYESVNESMFSMIDLIRQDSKDVRDFVKNVFKDKEFKKMSNDKDFIKYLKSIYEGVVEEAQSPAQKAAFQKMLDKKAGKDESKEEEVNEIAKFAGWVAIDHKGKRLEIKKSEAKDLYNAKLLAIKKLKVPKSKESMLVIKPGYNESVVNEINTSVNKRRAGAELKQKLKGKRSDGMGKYTATIYGLDSKGKRVELKSLNDLNKYSKFELDESVVNEKINPKFYDARVQWIDPKYKKKFVGDVVRYDNGEYKVNLGKDGRFEKYILAKEKDLKIVSKSKKKTFESVNEGLKHNDMYTMLDIAAGYSSTQDQAAGQMWSDEQDLYDYLKSDHIPKKYHKKFHNDIKRRFKNIKESVVNEAKEPEVITQLRKIVKDKQNALVVDTKSKKKVRVDMQSANLMVQVYDALKQQSNKDKFVKSGIVSMGHMAFKLLKKEGVNEAKDEIYFKSYTHAIEAAEVMALKKGYTIEDDEMFNKVGMNSKRPSVGKTTKVNLELLKNGKPQKKMLHIQVYGMKNSYELNAYIN